MESGGNHGGPVESQSVQVSVGTWSANLNALNILHFILYQTACI